VDASDIPSISERTSECERENASLGAQVSNLASTKAELDATRALLVVSRTEADALRRELDTSKVSHAQALAATVSKATFEAVQSELERLKTAQRSAVGDAEALQQKNNALRNAHTAAVSEAKALREAIDALKRAHEEALESKAKEASEIRSLYRKEKQHNGLFEKILNDKQKEVLLLKEAETKALDTARVKSESAVNQAEQMNERVGCLQHEARMLRLNMRGLRHEARMNRRQEFLVKGIVMKEVVLDPLQSVFAWSKRAKLIPRELAVSLDRQRVVILNAPGVANALLDQQLPLAQLVVTFGARQPALASLYVTLEPPPAEWQCFTLAFGARLIHLQAETDEVALNCVLGLQELSERLSCSAQRRVAAKCLTPSPPRSQQTPDEPASPPATTRSHMGIMSPRVPRTPGSTSKGDTSPTVPASHVLSSPCHELAPRVLSECELLWQRARMRLRANAAAGKVTRAAYLVRLFRSAAAERP